jgi:acyl carrier protein
MSYSSADIVTIMLTEVSHETSLEPQELDIHENFIYLGLDSVNCIFVLDRLEKIFKIEMNPVWFWDYPTIEKLAQKIYSELSQLKHD